MLKALRYGLYAQLLLGLARLFGMVPSQVIWRLHLIIGIVVAVSALIALGPLPQMGGDKMRVVARFAPSVSLFTGLLITAGMVAGRTFVMIHMLLGVITIGFVEMSAGRQRRMLGDNSKPN